MRPRDGTSIDIDFPQHPAPPSKSASCYNPNPAVLAAALDDHYPEARVPPRGRVLIVENEYVIATDIRDALSDAGYLVVGMAATANLAIEMARAEQPDLATMDIRLNGPGDGIKAAQHIQERFGIHSVFISAHGHGATRTRAELDACPLGWLAKPFQHTDLVSVVGAALILVRRFKLGN